MMKINCRNITKQLSSFANLESSRGLKGRNQPPDDAMLEDQDAIRQRFHTDARSSLQLWTLSQRNPLEQFLYIEQKLNTLKQNNCAFAM